MQNCYVPISALKNFIEPVSVSVAQIVGIICGPDLLLQTQNIFFLSNNWTKKHTCVWSWRAFLQSVFFFWMEKQ